MRSLFCFACFLCLSVSWVSAEEPTVEAAEPEAVGVAVEAAEPEVQGNTFFVDKGGDLDKLLERKHPKDAEGKFEIDIEQLPKKFIQIAISAYDLDEEKGEVNTVFFNDHKLGNLSGTNNMWNTTVFDLQPDWVKLGKNQVRFIIKDESKKGTINWSGKIGWAQVLTDGGIGETGRLYDLKIKELPKKNKVEVSNRLEVKKKGKFKLETTVFDPGGNALDASVLTFKGTPKDSGLRKQLLPFAASLPSGDYRVVSNLFSEIQVEDEPDKSGKKKMSKMWYQQVTVKESFFHFGPSVGVIPGIEPPKVRTLEVVPVDVDLKDLFAEKGLTEEQSQRFKVVQSLVKIVDPKILSATLEGSILKITPKGKGKTAIRIQGKLGGAKLVRKIQVTVAALEIGPDQELTKITLPETNALEVDVSRLFKAMELTPEQSKEFEIKQSLVEIDDPELLSATLKDGVLKLTPKVSGETSITIKGTLRGATLVREIPVTIGPVEIEVDQEVTEITMPETNTLELDVSKLFKVIGLTPEQAKQFKIKQTLLELEDPELLSATLKDGLLKLTPKAYGETELRIQGQLLHSKLVLEIPVTIEEVDRSFSVRKAIKPTVYFAFGPETLVNYNTVTHLAIGTSLPVVRFADYSKIGQVLGEFLPGFKADLELVHASHKGTNTRNNLKYDNSFEMTALAAYLGMNLKIPGSWLPTKSFLGKVQVSLKTGVALASIAIKSTPHDPSVSIEQSATGLSAYTTTSTGMSYPISENFVLMGNLIQFGSDVQVARLEVHYNLDQLLK